MLVRDIKSQAETGPTQEEQRDADVGRMAKGDDGGIHLWSFCDNSLVRNDQKLLALTFLCLFWVLLLSL